MLDTHESSNPIAPTRMQTERNGLTLPLGKEERKEDDPQIKSGALIGRRGLAIQAILRRGDVELFLSDRFQRKMLTQKQ